MTKYFFAYFTWLALGAFVIRCYDNDPTIITYLDRVFARVRHSRLLIWVVFTFFVTIWPLTIYLDHRERSIAAVLEQLTK